ncbi:MAG: L-histidine N(alpha)-methyltransferase [Nodosilinea sp. LVE1205-7]
MLEPGDYFLLGIDLQKDTAILEAAYNDRQGVTAAFNVNMLAHLNHRFAGNFNLEAFHHQAIYNPGDCQIEMYLHCRQPQSVQLKTLDLSFDLARGTAFVRRFRANSTWSKCRGTCKPRGSLPY